MRIKPRTSHASPTRVFPRLAPVTCICFELRLVRYAVFGCRDWPEQLLWFWFYDTQLKTALLIKMALTQRKDQDVQRNPHTFLTGIASQG